MKKIFLLITLSMFLLQGCNNNNDDNGPDLPEIDVKITNNTKFGKILTDSKGMSLYFFSKDTKDTSECLDGCLDVWPIFYEENLTVDSGLNLSDFSTITRSDGLKQTTFMGWPLYYFASDGVSGDTNGDKVNNVWYIAKPDYSLMYVVSQLVGADGKNYKSDYTEGDQATFYITDINGQTLYTFIKDTENSNNFTEDDFSNNGVWPIAEINLDKLPSILDANDFNTIDVFGRTQQTYKGRPMYYFGQDNVRGDNKGVSVPVPGGIWPIANTETTAASPASVKVLEDDTLGEIIADKDGMSLYFFSKDSKDTSECLDGCLTNWPIFYDENLRVNNDLDFADFGTITRSDGKMQNTYKGWPLYYFTNDTQSGDTNGDNVNSVWFIAKPDYSLMYVAAQLVGHDGLNYTSDYTSGDGLTKYITDINGKTTYRGEVKRSGSGFNFDLHVNDYRNGVYFVRMSDGEKVFMGKFIKE